MLDPKFIRENPDRLKEVVMNKGANPEFANVDKWLELDEKRTQLTKDSQSLNQERNEIAKKLASGDRTEELKNRGRELKEQEQKIREELEIVEKQWLEVSSYFPNIPYPGITVGKDDMDNPEIFAWRPDTGEISKDKLGKGYDAAQYMPEKLLHTAEEFVPRHHQEILEIHDLAEFAQGAKVSGTRFVYLKGDLVRLQFAIQNYVLQHLYAKNFTPIIPPLMVKEQALFGTSHFPEGRDQVYEIKTDYLEEKNSLYLVGSSEPSNFALFMDKTVREEELPYKMVAITPCFRSEVGSWGKDVRGLKRVHQFDKLEMDVVCTPEQSQQIYDELLSINHWLLQSLKLPYHVVEKCTGDSGYNASARQADPEVWLPGQKAFMEVMTDTNATDFQARRLNIRYIDKEGNKKLCHTVNDTGVAMGRMLVAIIENYQQSDGSVKIPEVLIPYTGFDTIPSKK